MRSLVAARIVLLDSDHARRAALGATLAEFGTFEVVSIATVAEAATAAGAAPDIFIVEGPGLAANDEAGVVSQNPFLASGIPTILLLPAATNEQRRQAVRAGYTAALGAPVAPRLLYRRIAHLLQNARRAKRRAERMTAAAPSLPLVEVEPVTLAPSAKVSAQ